jgi:predicted aspartyl protease
MFLDTGASIEALIPKSLADSINAKIHSLPPGVNITLEMADANTAVPLGYTHIDIFVQGMKSKVCGLVIDVPHKAAQDVILGQGWLRRHRVIMDYGMMIVLKNYLNILLLLILELM